LFIRINRLDDDDDNSVDTLYDDIDVDLVEMIMVTLMMIVMMTIILNTIMDDILIAMEHNNNNNNNNNNNKNSSIRHHNWVSMPLQSQKIENKKEIIRIIIKTVL
jgi:hypothetical protein